MVCVHCESSSLWLPDQMIYPFINPFPDANIDLNDDDVKVIYNEAASIAGLSPRGACALLRLAIEKLLNQLGKSGTIIEKRDN